MAVGLTSYLLKQGAGEITVITPYLRQLYLLRVSPGAHSSGWLYRYKNKHTCICILYTHHY
jgi:hypothetical protein